MTPWMRLLIGNALISLNSKREYGQRKVFRRRAAPSPAVIEPEADRAQVVDSEGQSTLANITIPGLRRHRQLKNRSRLWSFF